jgi:hypothetical protein
VRTERGRWSSARIVLHEDLRHFGPAFAPDGAYTLLAGRWPEGSWRHRTREDRGNEQALRRQATDPVAGGRPWATVDHRITDDPPGYRPSS